VKEGSPESKLDLALIAADEPCNAAGVFTRNRVKAAPVLLSQQRLKNKYAKLQAIILNSGNANACAVNDTENALAMSRAAANALGIEERLVGVASTGVIGQELNIAAIEKAVPSLAGALGGDESNSAAAADAIMTTDTVRKEFAAECTTDSGVVFRIGGICKGSGMIHPNMGTLLCVLTTDAFVASGNLRISLIKTTNRTLNRVSVDGDTSTNDSVFLLSSGKAGAISSGELNRALNAIMTEMARSIARDGEGATKLITCTVKNAIREAFAEKLSKSIINSSLVKAMIFGKDANFGRVLCAMGYSGSGFNPNEVDIALGSKAGIIDVCRRGRGIEFDEAFAKTVLGEDEIEIIVNLNSGAYDVTCWGCDLTYDYVRINGDYRS
jgi:glutamate N-acetyltransferase/amino-acid N-acetyltransferase